MTWGTIVIAAVVAVAAWSLAKQQEQDLREDVALVYRKAGGAWVWSAPGRPESPIFASRDEAIADALRWGYTVEG